MNSRLLTPQEPDSWKEVLGHFADADVYDLPEYHRAHELHGDGSAYAFVATEGRDTLFHPFLARRIVAPGLGEEGGERLHDLETVYGYAGPLATTREPAFLSQAWEAFSRWCRELRVVAEFIRFNPLSQNQQFVDASCQLVRDRQTVLLDLEGTEEALWGRYPSVQRNMVRKAIKRGLICDEGTVEGGLGEFQRLYRQTMVRVGAKAYYDFQDAYYRALAQGLGPRLRLFRVREKERVVASALFLVFGDRLHYHLAGSDAEYREAAPNNLLLHTVALWGQRQGLRRFHLGGGLSSDPNDPLLRFKTSLSMGRLDYCTGRRIHDAHAYEALCSAWMRRTGAAERPGYFLLYRLGEAP
jgi:hypothetical protein